MVICRAARVLTRDCAPPPEGVELWSDMRVRTIAAHGGGNAMAIVSCAVTTVVHALSLAYVRSFRLMHITQSIATSKPFNSHSRSKVCQYKSYFYPPSVTSFIFFPTCRLKPSNESDNPRPLKRAAAAAAIPAQAPAQKY
jgi:hypothetical protein